ncbi:MAG TPA: hypothetical protein VGB68_06510 [Pyrinomonadaceae bacterium]|jgi:hypothetical protein
MKQETTHNHQTATAEKIFKDREVWVGTFLGGPLVAGYMIAHNFKTFGDGARARKTWIIAFAATLALFGIALFAPYIERIPQVAIPLVYTGMAFVLVRLYQGEKIAVFVGAGGRIHSWWRTIGVTIAGMVITFVPFLGAAYAVEAVRNANVVAKKYGASGHEIAFDKTNLAESEIDALAAGFEQNNFFDDGGSWYVYVRKIENSYEIFVSVERGISNRPQDVKLFARLRDNMQKLFPNNRIVFNLVVDDLDDVVRRLE